MSFASAFGPWLAVATALLLTAAFAFDYTRRRRLIERMGHPPAVARLIGSMSFGRRRLKAVLFTTAMTALALAAGRPQMPGETVWRQRGIDMVLVMDMSKSMLAGDVYPNRLVRVQTEIEHLVAELAWDRLGIVVFAGGAAYFPLTHDHRAALSLYAGMTPADLPPGSDLGQAVRVARCILRPGLADDPGCGRLGGRDPGGSRDPLAVLKQRAGAVAQGNAVQPEAAIGNGLAERARAMVIFTDGEDTGEETAAEIAAAAVLGIDVFLVGVGTTQGELVPELSETGERRGWKTTADGKSFVTTRLDVERLAGLAAVAGAERRLTILDPERLHTKKLIDDLKRLQRGDLDERLLRRPKDVYHWFVFPAFMLLIIDACISVRTRRQPRDGAAVFIAFWVAFWVAVGVLPSSACSRMDEDELDEARVQFNLGVDSYRLAESKLEGEARVAALHAAEAAFRRAAELATGEDVKVSASYNLGNTLFRLERYDDAISAYQKVLRLRPHANDARYNLELALGHRRAAEPAPDSAGAAQPPEQPGPLPPLPEGNRPPVSSGDIPGREPPSSSGLGLGARPSEEPQQGLGQAQPPGAHGPDNTHAEAAGSERGGAGVAPSTSGTSGSRDEGRPPASGGQAMDDMARRLSDLERTSQSLKRQALKRSAQKDGQAEAGQTATPVQDW